jgi:anti-sigma B factor antagonist
VERDLARERPAEQDPGLDGKADGGAVGESANSSLRLETVSEDGCVTVLVIGDVDLFGAPQLQAVVEKAIDGGASELVLDLSATEFLDSTGLNVLALAVRRLRTVDGTLRLTHPSVAVRQLLRISALDGFIELDGC